MKQIFLTGMFHHLTKIASYPPPPYGVFTLDTCVRTTVCIIKKEQTASAVWKIFTSRMLTCTWSQAVSSYFPNCTNIHPISFRGSEGNFPRNQRTSINKQTNCFDLICRLLLSQVILSCWQSKRFKSHNFDMVPPILWITTQKYQIMKFCLT